MSASGQCSAEVAACSSKGFIISVGLAATAKAAAAWKTCSDRSGRRGWIFSADLRRKEAEEPESEHGGSAAEHHSV